MNYPVARKMLLVLLAVLMTSAAAVAAEPVKVLLKGKDDAITGYLREVGQARFILQSEGAFYQFEAQELISVNGRTTPAPEDLGQGRLVTTALYEKVLADGDVEVWTNLDIENTGTAMIEIVDWGAAAWELENGYSCDLRDQFGNSLPVEIIPRADGNYRIEVQLPVPVAPLETVRLNLKTLRRGAAHLTEGGTWRYQYNVDYPEDRFFVRKIELPAGTEVDVPAGWWLHEMDGRLFLHSYFYYPARTRVPQVIEYRLP